MKRIKLLFYWKIAKIRLSSFNMKSTISGGISSGIANSLFKISPLRMQRTSQTSQYTLGKWKRYYTQWKTFSFGEKVMYYVPRSQRSILPPQEEFCISRVSQFSLWFSPRKVSGYLCSSDQFNTHTHTQSLIVISENFHHERDKDRHKDKVTLRRNVSFLFPFSFYSCVCRHFRN